MSLNPHGLADRQGPNWAPGSAPKTRKWIYGSPRSLTGPELYDWAWECATQLHDALDRCVATGIGDSDYAARCRAELWIFVRVLRMHGSYEP